MLIIRYNDIELSTVNITYVITFFTKVKLVLITWSFQSLLKIV